MIINIEQSLQAIKSCVLDINKCTLPFLVKEKGFWHLAVATYYYNDVCYEDDIHCIDVNNDLYNNVWAYDCIVFAANNDSCLEERDEPILAECKAELEFLNFAPKFEDPIAYNEIYKRYCNDLQFYINDSSAFNAENVSRSFNKLTSYSERDMYRLLLKEVSPEFLEIVKV